MAYTLGNKCAKNLCKPTVLLQLIIKNVVTCFFFGTQCRVTRRDYNIGECESWLPGFYFTLVLLPAAGTLSTM